MKVVVLGGHGFVGTNLMELFGDEAVALSRADGVDLRDYTITAKRIRQPSCPTHIINLAAHVGSVKYVGDNPATVIHDNMRMVLNVYRAATYWCNPTPVIINTIASCGYPGHLNLYEESELWNGPVHPSVLSFGSARRMIDAVSRCYRAEHGIQSMNLLVPNVYGPHDSLDPERTHAMNALAIKFVRAAEEQHEEVEIWGSGKPVREWLYVKDLARFLHHLTIDSEHLLQLPPFAAGDPLNIGQGDGISINDAVAALKRITAFGGRIRHNLDYPDGAPKKVMSPTKFRRLFPGFEFTSLEAGLQETVEHFKERLNA